MDSGDGENLENLSTCLGMPSTETFFNRNRPSLILAQPLRTLASFSEHCWS